MLICVYVFITKNKQLPKRPPALLSYCVRLLKIGRSFKFFECAPLSLTVIILILPLCVLLSQGAASRLQSEIAPSLVRRRQCPGSLCTAKFAGPRASLTLPSVQLLQDQVCAQSCTTSGPGPPGAAFTIQRRQEKKQANRAAQILLRQFEPGGRAVARSGKMHCGR